MFQSSHCSITKKLLPRPYETGCFSYSKLNFTNSIECIERCIVLKSVRKWGAISRGSLVSIGVHDYKFLNSSNFTKKRAELEEIRLSCQSSCPNTSCEDTHIVTIQESSAHIGWDSLFSKNLSITWQRQIPSIPSAKISCRPSSSPIELLLYMMSSVSTWTGLSMMSINPILLLRNLSKRKSAPRMSPLELRERRKIRTKYQTVQMSRFENHLLSQNQAIERLRQMVFLLLNERSRSVG